MLLHLLGEHALLMQQVVSADDQNELVHNCGGSVLQDLPHQVLHQLLLKQTYQFCVLSAIHANQTRLIKLDGSQKSEHDELFYFANELITEAHFVFLLEASFFLRQRILPSQLLICLLDLVYELLERRVLLVAAILRLRDKGLVGGLEVGDELSYEAADWVRVDFNLSLNLLNKLFQKLVSTNLLICRCCALLLLLFELDVQLAKYALETTTSPKVSELLNVPNISTVINKD